jgi:hypothetical protein
VGFDFEPASYPSDVVDRDVPLRPLDAAEISAIDPALVRKSFLAQFTRSPKPAHIPRQNVPQRPFVSLFHKGDFGSITLLRRPLLSYIRCQYLQIADAPASVFGTLWEVRRYRSAVDGASIGDTVLPRL